MLQLDPFSKSSPDDTALDSFYTTTPLGEPLSVLLSIQPIQYITNDGKMTLVSTQGHFNNLVFANMFSQGYVSRAS